MKKNEFNADFIIDGRFFTQKLTGVQRVGFELLNSLAKRKDVRVIVALPPDVADVCSEAENITYIKVGKFKGNLWEQCSLPRYCKKMGLPLLCTGNLAPILGKHYVIIHDVTFKEKHNYQEKKSWLRKIKFLTRCIIYRCRGVFTVSEFSADRIVHFYPRLKARPTVVYNGHEHVLRWKEEPLDGLPIDYYFSVGTTNPNKNFKYILDLAKANPDKQFIIAGKPIQEFTEYANNNGLENFRFLGYVTDGQMAWLYHHCRGFILPSVYEGFGIPPLEAIASGCRALYLSDIPVFREIYGGAAKYFDPLNYDETVSLGGETMTEEEAQELLSKYSWDKMTDTIVETIKRGQS